MKPSTPWSAVVTGVCLALALTAVTAADAPAPREIELRGRIVCLAETMQRDHQVVLPPSHEHLWGFRTVGGEFYTLLRTKNSEALFADARLREKELILKGRVFPGSRIFEMTFMRSVRNGVVHELFYYCDICAVKALVPGECVCCREPVVLIERPVKDTSEL